MKRIGFAGLGIMGSGMAANLIKKGYQVTVWNRSSDKCEPLAEMGAEVAATPAELAARSEVVISMVRDDAAVRELLSGPQGAFNGAEPGTTFIECSTVTPGLVREMVEIAKAKKFQYLDAPVTGSKGAAAGGQLNFLVGGPAEVLEAQRDVLEAMGQSITHFGPNGSSAYFKLANNQLAGAMLATLGESLAMVEEAGINREVALEALVGTVTRVMGLKKAKVLNEDWSTEFALELMHKDLTQALIAANDFDLPMPIIAAARETFQRAKLQGLAKEDFAAVTKASKKK